MNKNKFNEIDFHRNRFVNIQFLCRSENFFRKSGERPPTDANKFKVTRLKDIQVRRTSQTGAKINIAQLTSMARHLLHE